MGGDGQPARGSRSARRYSSGDAMASPDAQSGERLRLPHFAPKAKRAIYLFMSGGPSQVDLLDYKPHLTDLYDKDIPDSVRGAQQLTGMTAGQARFPIAPSHWGFKRYGKTGTWVSDLLPYTAQIVDDLAIIKSTNTEAINHEPAIMLMNTGNMNAGKPCLGSWLSYGLGSMNDNLPTFMVLQSKLNTKEDNQPVSSRLWSSGFLSSEYAGVGLRSAGDPVLYLTDPSGVDREVRRNMLDAVNEINRQTFEELGDPETHARIAQYEMAYRMQTSVPELADLSKEPKSTWDLYGPDAKEPGTFAYNCLMARRMAERGVRFTQVYKRGWDMHDNVTGTLADHLPGDRPRLLRAGHRSQAARPAGRHARHLGRRIWPHRLQPGRSLQRELRPRSSSALLHHLDDGRRRAHRHHLWRDG